MSDDSATILVLNADGDRIRIPVRKALRPNIPRPGA